MSHQQAEIHEEKMGMVLMELLKARTKALGPHECG
jgi:hypothetical protein